MPRTPTRRTSAHRRRRAAILAGFAAIVLVAVAVIAGGAGKSSRATRSGRQSFTVGAGPRSARVLLPGTRRRATVIFLHGWGLSGRRAYAGWLRHLVARGSPVIVPRYQASLRTNSQVVPDNAIAGVRAALRRVRPRPRKVVVIGHSVGGVLAVDYAARAAALGLPRAAGVMIVYPGGAFKNMPPVPEVDPAEIPASVGRLLVFESTTDDIVGTTPAETIAAGAVNVPSQRRSLVTIDDPTAGDHFAPAVDSPQSRREFWARADRLIAAAG